MPPASQRFVDTNVLLRFLTADLPEPAERCAALIQRLRDGEEVAHLSPLAAAEVVWTLECYYRLSRPAVAARVLPLLKLKGLRLEGKRTFLAALALYAHQNVSFTDAYIAVQMAEAECHELYSYDRDFDRLPSVRRLEP